MTRKGVPVPPEKQLLEASDPQGQAGLDAIKVWGKAWVVDSVEALEVWGRGRGGVGGAG